MIEAGAWDDWFCIKLASCQDSYKVLLWQVVPVLVVVVAAEGHAERKY